MTGNSAISKRQYQRRPGLKEAAEQLQVSYGHLRLCVAGKRISSALLARYLDWKSKQPQQLPASNAPGKYKNSRPIKRVPPPIEIAAADNLSPEFFEVLSKLGQQIVIVRLASEIDSPVWEHTPIELNLDRALQAVQAGSFDSSYFTLGEQYHFFHVSDLAKAMQALKSELDERGLLKISTIYHAETPDEWVVWFPGTAERLDLAADSES